MRSRNIKPKFFKNSKLGKLTPYHRLLFAGLWCMADGHGRLKDEPDEIKIECLPWDDIDVDPLLDDLCQGNDPFIYRYESNGYKVIQVCKFETHQHPHKSEREAASLFPPKPDEKYEQEINSRPTNPAQSENQAEPVRLNDECLKLNDERRLLNDEAPPTSRDDSDGCSSRRFFPEGIYFQISNRGEDYDEAEWIYRCLVEQRRNKNLSLMGCDDLNSLLTMFSGNRDLFRRWVTHPIYERMAAFAYTVDVAKTDEPFKYALNVLENGLEWEKVRAYLQQTKAWAAEGDYKVSING